MDLTAIPVLPANAPAIMPAPPVQKAGAPLVVAGPMRPFPEMLAALTEGRAPAAPLQLGEAAELPQTSAPLPAPSPASSPAVILPGQQAETGNEPSGAEPGKDLPEPAAEGGNTLPVAIVPVPLTLATILPQTIVPEPAPAASKAAPPAQPFADPRFIIGTGAPEQVTPLADPDTVKPDAEGQAVPVPAVAAPAKGDADQRPEIQISREAAPVPTTPALTVREAPSAPSAQPLSSVAASPVAAEQIEALVEVLAQAREAGRGARGDVTLRHGEFGTVAIRIEQSEGETRAVLNGRDPGFAPAVMAALADRATTGSSDTQQPSQQRGGEQPGQATSQGQSQSDARQPDRRQMQHDFSVPPRASRSDRDGNASGEQDQPPGRFA